jgi:predicted amidohydrolase
MFSVGFSPHTDRIAEPPDGPSTAFLSAAARDHGLWAVGSVCVRRADGGLPRNEAVLAATDGTVHRYAKRHLFSYAGEHRRMSAGGPTLTVDVDGLRTTVFVCYDLRFADDFWRTAPGTDAYVVVANWPAARRAHWRSLLVARAVENQAWVVGANRVGVGGNLEYAGDSLVVDPMGEVVADGAGAGEATLRAVLDPGRVAEVRARYPFLRDREVPVPLAPDEPTRRDHPDER